MNDDFSREYHYSEQSAGNAKEWQFELGQWLENS